MQQEHWGATGNINYQETAHLGATCSAHSKANSALTVPTRGTFHLKQSICGFDSGQIATQLNAVSK